MTKYFPKTLCSLDCCRRAYAFRRFASDTVAVNKIEWQCNDIFILDDDEDVRKTLCAILDTGGYRGVCFADETSLHEGIRQRCPAAVMLDVILPGRSGLEILKGLAVYSTPVVMMSGYGDIRTAVTAMKHGALDFIQKPFKQGDILDRLGEIVTRFSPRCTPASRADASCR